MFGICGALRCDEITNLKFQDVEDTGNKFIATVRNTKTHIDRQFIIGTEFHSLVKKYIQLRPLDYSMERFFICYAKGKCNRQAIGKNKIGEVPQLIASFLDLPNPKDYTGHCFRRTAATLLSDSGASIQQFELLGGWRSEQVALGYVKNSMHAKQNIYKGIIHASTPKDSVNAQPSTSTCNAPLNPNSDAQEQPIILEWEDFCEDFTVSDAANSTTTGFVTAAGANISTPTTKLSSPLKKEFQETSITLPPPNSKATSSEVQSITGSLAQKHNFFNKQLNDNTNLMKTKKYNFI